MARWSKGGTQSQTYTPTLKRNDTGAFAVTPEEKAEALRRSFFPRPPEADTSDILAYRYLPALPDHPIQAHETQQALDNMAPNKAPGPDELPARILRLLGAELVAPATRLFNAALEQGYCPRHFRQSTTIALRKPGKDDYQEPKWYRPIALLNTLGMVMESIIATRLSYLAETHKLLPENHLGGRKLNSPEHAVHLLTSRIQTAVGQGQVASPLLLDVAGAFDNVPWPRLLHNMRNDAYRVQ